MHGQCLARAFPFLKAEADPRATPKTRHKMNNHVYNNQEANRKRENYLHIKIQIALFFFLYSCTLDPIRPGRLEKITRVVPTQVGIGPVKNMYTKILTKFTFSQMGVALYFFTS